MARVHKAVRDTPPAEAFYRWDDDGRLSVCLKPVYCHPPTMNGGKATSPKDFSPWFTMRSPLFWHDEVDGWYSIVFAKWRMTRHKGYETPPGLEGVIIVLTQVDERFTVANPRIATAEDIHAGIELLECIAAGGKHIDVLDTTRSGSLKQCIWAPIQRNATPKPSPYHAFIWNDALGHSEEVDISGEPDLLPWYMRFDDAIEAPTIIRKQRAPAGSARKKQPAPVKKTWGASKYRGVFYILKSFKWCATITHQGKKYYGGLHSTEDDAARAYNRLAIELKGDKAKLNIIENTAPECDTLAA